MSARRYAAAQASLGYLDRREEARDPSRPSAQLRCEHVAALIWTLESVAREDPDRSCAPAVRQPGADGRVSHGAPGTAAIGPGLAGLAVKGWAEPPPARGSGTWM